MTINYFIFKLRVGTVFKLLRAAASAKEGTVTYIECTKPAGLLLNFFAKRSLSVFSLVKIQQRTGPAGPLLKLHNVRDDKGRVITFDINFHVLKLRRRILDRLPTQWRDFSFFKAYGSHQMLHAFLGIRIAQDINGLVFLADYARWILPRGENTRNILIMPRSDWSDILAEDFKTFLDDVVIEKRLHRRLSSLFLLFKHVLRALPGSLGSTNEESTGGSGSDSVKEPTVMVSYAMGVVDGKRNDIAFYHALKDRFAPSRLLFYFRFMNLYPSAEELDWFQSNQVRCFTSHLTAPSIPDLPEWRPTVNFKPFINRFYKIFIGTALQTLIHRSGGPVWLLNTLWELGWNTAYWQDFFTSNHIKMIVHSVPGVWNFVPNFALSECGGIAVNLERSILFDYCTYFHNSPNHVGFVTGSYSLTQIPEPSFTETTIQSGGLNVGNHPVIPWIKEKQTAGKIVVAVFDELPNDWYFGESIRHFYEAVAQLVVEDLNQRFVLVIKTKKPEILERLETVAAQVQDLTASDRCLFPDWKFTPSAVAAQSDLVLCVSSTAMFESVLTGARTIVFNPGKAGSSLFYSNNGLGRRVFEESEAMIDGIRRFADGNDDAVGDCSDLIAQIDPFNDDNGALRVGEYILDCLEGFRQGLPRNEIILQANESYGAQWGEDKITCFQITTIPERQIIIK